MGHNFLDTQYMCARGLIHLYMGIGQDYLEVQYVCPLVSRGSNLTQFLWGKSSIRTWQKKLEAEDNMQSCSPRPTLPCVYVIFRALNPRSAVPSTPLHCPAYYTVLRSRILEGEEHQLANIRRRKIIILSKKILFSLFRYQCSWWHVCVFPRWLSVFFPVLNPRR